MLILYFICLLHIHFNLSYLVGSLMVVQINESTVSIFPCLVVHIHKLFSVGIWISPIKLWTLGFICSFPFNPYRNFSWIKYKILSVIYVSFIIRYSKNKTESPYFFSEKFFLSVTVLSELYPPKTAYI